MKIIPIIITVVSLVVLTMSNNSIAYTNDAKKLSSYDENSGLQSDAGKVVIQFHQAIQKSYKQKARSFLADDVIIYEGGRVERSADDYANHHMLADMDYLADMNIEILEHRVIVLGDLAYSMSRTKLMGNVNGKKIEQEGMETMILLKKEGKWKISHIHWSH